MSTIHFQKWQGAGNDFIIIDNRNNAAGQLNNLTINMLCDRHFGIGADGLMLIGPSSGFDFEMIFFNSDGFPAEMCGNGGRCIAAMANAAGIFDKTTTFLTTDGPHQAEMVQDGLVKLRMTDIQAIKMVTVPILDSLHSGTGVFLNTGVPHLVVFTGDVNSVNVDATGRMLRNMDQFSPAGTNVNFVEEDGRTLKVRTYERGVEGETLACGTGNVAAAIAAEWLNNSGFSEYICNAVGGQLRVSFNRLSINEYTNIWLEGPAVRVFEGSVVVP